MRFCDTNTLSVNFFIPLFLHPFINPSFHNHLDIHAIQLPHFSFPFDQNISAPSTQQASRYTLFSRKEYPQVPSKNFTIIYTSYKNHITKSIIIETHQHELKNFGFPKYTSERNTFSLFESKRKSTMCNVLSSLFGNKLGPPFDLRLS